ncbi:hypothetical protein BGX28_001719 [Mortierella sp. GBA30]|nr:hypothetical protein BGX28_001719 [Mortierella sp. GBA30]
MELVSGNRDEAAAELNYAPDQLALGYCFRNGVGVPTEPKKLSIGSIVRPSKDIGLEQEQDYEMAAKYYSMAAAQNHARAQDKLGVCLKIGQHIAQDVKLAVRYFRLVTGQGHLAAQYHLADALEKGLGCEEEASM